MQLKQLSLEEQQKKLQEWQANEWFEHFFGLADDVAEQQTAFILNTVPQTIFDFANREQTAGEIRGLKWLRGKVKEAAEKLATEIRSKDERQQQPVTESDPGVNADTSGR